MKTGTRLDPILHAVKERAAERRRHQSLADLRSDVQPDRNLGEVFRARFAWDSFGILAECKRHSPAKGTLSTEVDLQQRACQYRDGGAAAISVLTEEDHFRGSLRDFEQLASLGIPRLRKDFILDAGMVYESAQCGAEAILLIVRCLPGSLLQELRSLAGELGMAVLMEIHDTAELERAVPTSPDFIGINSRDLTTFEIRLELFEELLPQIPAGIGKIVESGLDNLAALQAARKNGAHGALIGEALMRHPDPQRLLRSWMDGLRTEDHP